MKLFGLILLSLIPTSIGIWYGEKLREKSVCTSSLLDLLNFIKVQIEVYLRPQNKMFHLFNNKYLQSNSFLQALIKNIEKRPYCGFSQTVNEYKDIFPIDNVLKNELVDFSSTFGELSKEMQVTELNKIIKTFEQYDVKTKKVLESKIKLSYVIGFSIGIGLIILNI